MPPGEVDRAADRIGFHGVTAIELRDWIGVRLLPWPTPRAPDVPAGGLPPIRTSHGVAGGRSPSITCSHQAVSGLGSGHTIGSAASGSHAPSSSGCGPGRTGGHGTPPHRRAPAAGARGSGRGSPREGAPRPGAAHRSDNGMSSSSTGAPLPRRASQTAGAFAPADPHPTRGSPASLFDAWFSSIRPTSPCQP